MSWIWLWTKAFYPCCDHPSETFISLLIIIYYFITIIILLLDGGNRIQMPRIFWDSDYGPLRWRQSNHDAARICREPDLGHKPTPSWLGISAYSHDSRGPANWIMTSMTSFYPCSDIHDLVALELRENSIDGCQTINSNFYYYLVKVNFTKKNILYIITLLLSYWYCIM